MAIIELNQKQLDYIACLLAVYSTKLREYKDEPSQSMENADYVLILAEKFRILASSLPMTDAE